MKNSDSITICLVTKENFDIVSASINSIRQLCTLHNERNVRLLVLDKSQQSQLGIWLKQHWNLDLIYEDKTTIEKRDRTNEALYDRIGYNLDHDSIQRARIQLMLATRVHLNADQGIVWQIDDDMLFGEAISNSGNVIPKVSRNFFSEVRAYRKLNPDVDAAIGTCTFAPPLPILLYFLHQLRDLVSGRFFNPVFSGEGEDYHDLYGNTEEETEVRNIQDLDSDLIKRMLQGIPVTRPILSSKASPITGVTQPTILRGGNFIIFNPQLAIALPHLAFGFDRLISRRSDMIHAWMLSQKGFRVCKIDLALFHNRAFPSVDILNICQEYLRDALGAIAFRYLESVEKASSRLIAHIDHLEKISAFLKSIKETLPEIIWLRQELALSLQRLKGWEQKGVFRELNDFKGLVQQEMKMVP